MSKKSDNIRVVCRFRPKNEMEEKMDSEIIYAHKPETNSVSIEQHHARRHLNFHFDCIFGSNTAQVDVFKESALPLIDNLFEGYNATIFAYGQTGSGKTYTMMGEHISELHPKVGIITRVVSEIWSRMVGADSHMQFVLKVSFLEIYNEDIFDLLLCASSGNTGDDHAKEKKKKKGHECHKKNERLIIRERDDQVFVEGLSEISVHDQNELCDLIKTANAQRISAETKMNRTSSRSHAVLTIILEQEDTCTSNVKKSKFCLVDLAGSEKVGKTQSTGIRLKEATSINTSLTTLGTCMNKLAENSSNSENSSLRHIPFRESVLTRLLSDSLGGNCKTTLMINCSPCAYNVEETISTLRFGARAKKIETKARINQSKTAQQYRRELAVATSEILKLYRIIEDCAFDINAAFKGALSVENCRSYKKLLDLKKYTLQMKKSETENAVSAVADFSNIPKVNSNLLASLLPDLTHLQSLKTVKTIKKQQTKLGNGSGNVPGTLQTPMLPRTQQQQHVLNAPRASTKIPVSPNILKPQPSPSTASSSSLLRKNVPLDSFGPPGHGHPSLLVYDRTFLSLADSDLSVYSYNESDRDGEKPPTILTTTTKNTVSGRDSCDSFEALDDTTDVTVVRKKVVDPLKKKCIKKDFKVTAITAQNITQSMSWVPKGFKYEQVFGGQPNDDNAPCLRRVDSFGIPVESDYSPTETEYSEVESATGTETKSEFESEYGEFDFDEFVEEELPKREMNAAQRRQWAEMTAVQRRQWECSATKLVHFRNKIDKEIDWLQWHSDDDDDDDDDDNCRENDSGDDDDDIERMERFTLENEVEFNRARIVMLCRLLRSKSQTYESRVQVESNKYHELKTKYSTQTEDSRRLTHENTLLEKEYENVCAETRELSQQVRTAQRQAEDARKQMVKLQKQLTLKMNELNLLQKSRNVNGNMNGDAGYDEMVVLVHKNVAAMQKFKLMESRIERQVQQPLDVRFSQLCAAYKSQNAQFGSLVENVRRLQTRIRGQESEEQQLREEIVNKVRRQNEPAFGLRKSRRSIDGADELQAIKNRTEKTLQSRTETKTKSSRSPVATTTQNESRAFHMTPSQRTALTSVKMKIRGGGGSDDEVYRTPVKTSKTITAAAAAATKIKTTTTRHQRNVLQPISMNQSLPRLTNYSSDEAQTSTATTAMLMMSSSGKENR